MGSGLHQPEGPATIAESASRGVIPILIVMSFFLPYVRGFLTIPLYVFIFALLLPFVRLARIDLLICSAIVAFFFGKAYQLGYYHAVQVTRVYFGFYFFYLFFRIASPSTTPNFNTAVICLCCCILLEAILVNTVVSPEHLTVYPNFATSSGKTQIFGFYQRPFSIGSNSSVTSIILVAMLMVANVQRHIDRFTWKTEVAASCAVLILCSGSGIFALAVYFLSVSKPTARHRVIGGLLISYFAIFTANQATGLSGILNSSFTKISPWYIRAIIELKFNQFYGVLNEFAEGDSVIRWLFGAIDSSEKANSIGLFGGDFGWLDHLAAVGMFGTILYLVIILPKLTRRNIVPVGMMIAASVHYSSIVSVIGQIVFGYCLAKGGQFLALDDGPEVIRPVKHLQLIGENLHARIRRTFPFGRRVKA